MKEKRAFPDAPWPNERYTLPVAQQPKHLGRFRFTTDKIFNMANCAPVEKRIICTHVDAYCNAEPDEKEIVAIHAQRVVTVCILLLALMGPES